MRVKAIAGVLGVVGIALFFLRQDSRAARPAEVPSPIAAETS
jgi:hypothetical protein